MLGISACSRLQVLGTAVIQVRNTGCKYSTVLVQYGCTVLHGARMYTVPVVNTGTVQNLIQVQVLGNTLKLGVR